MVTRSAKGGVVVMKLQVVALRTASAVLVHIIALATIALVDGPPDGCGNVA